MINKKVRVALKAGLKVILCVGEPLAVRKKGLSAAKQYVKIQLQKDLKSLSSPPALTSSKRSRAGKSYVLSSKLIVAYEPIWAVGTGKPDDPKQAVEMSRFIKKFLSSKSYVLSPKVLYGGSVTSKNIGRIMFHKEIDGALVGGASLKPKEFEKIIKITSQWS